jgi:hypothetical protein
LTGVVASSRPGNPKLAPRAEAKAPTTAMAPFMNYKVKADGEK